MNSRVVLLLALATVGIAAVIYSPFHYSWRWRQNEEQYQTGLIIKDDWVGGQIFIPIESWGLGVLGAGTALFAGWQALRPVTFRRTMQMHRTPR